MKLIVGLGNPGKDYLDSRHNIGFLLIKALVKDCAAQLKSEKGCFALSAKARICGQDIRLAMPLTFMNLSGVAVGALLRKYKMKIGDLLIVCDDLDLEWGRIKIKEGGSSGGHKGVESIIDSLGTQAFSRLRIGIGRPRGNTDACAYVLSSFTKKEKGQLGQVIKEAIDCCAVWAKEGVARSMNIFNRYPKTKQD